MHTQQQTHLHHTAHTHPQHKHTFCLTNPVWVQLRRYVTALICTCKKKAKTSCTTAQADQGLCFLLARHYKWAPAWENQQCRFWQGLTQTMLYSYWRWLEAWNLYLGRRGILLPKYRKQRRWSALWLSRSWSASLFSHMQKHCVFSRCGLIMQRLSNERGHIFNRVS